MKIFYRILISSLLLIFFIIIYLSFFGFETKRFNNQISEKIKDIDPSLNLELKKIKIILNPLELMFDVKTIGPKLMIQNKVLGLENVKTQIQFSSLFNKNVKVKNLNISTKSVKLDDLISFVRILDQKPQLYILEKIVKKGFLVADIKINFDEKGKIKKDYIINGFVKDLDLSILKKNQLKKINFEFNYQENHLSFNDINFKFDNLNFSSKNLVINRQKKEYEIKGEFQNQTLSLNKKKY